MMPSREQGRLRIESDGGWPVSDTIEFLHAFKAAYENILIFEMLLEGFAAPRLSVPRTPILNNRGLNLSTALWELPDEALARFLRPDDQLILQRVELSSPGFWEFAGALNPLEVLRMYLNDRHRRRQDRTYREAHERHRLALENILLENQVFRERMRMAEEYGLSDQDMTQLLNRFVYEPIQQIDIIDARGMVSFGGNE